MTNTLGGCSDIAISTTESSRLIDDGLTACSKNNQASDERRIR